MIESFDYYKISSCTSICNFYLHLVDDIMRSFLCAWPWLSTLKQLKHWSDWIVFWLCLHYDYEEYHHIVSCPLLLDLYLFCIQELKKSDVTCTGHRLSLYGMEQLWSSCAIYEELYILCTVPSSEKPINTSASLSKKVQRNQCQYFSRA